MSRTRQHVESDVNQTRIDAVFPATKRGTGCCGICAAQLSACRSLSIISGAGVDEPTKAKAVTREVVTVQAPKASSKGRATAAAAPAIKKIRRKTHEAGMELYDSYDLNGETYCVGDDGEGNAWHAWTFFRPNVGLQYQAEAPSPHATPPPCSLPPQSTSSRPRT